MPESADRSESELRLTYRAVSPVRPARGEMSSKALRDSDSDFSAVSPASGDRSATSL